jgi:UDP-N-acetylglucosamine transferase subunit ALG13
MIFVTVGNMDPFDRLIRTVDAWAGGRTHGEEIFMQIGGGRYRPEHCRHVDFLQPGPFRETFSQARFVISHAGMGTIITALELSKPLVVMPKRASLGEQRNEHQLATVRRFRRSSRIRVAESDDELSRLLDSLSISESIEGASAEATEQWRPDSTLIEFVREFIAGDRPHQSGVRPAVPGAAS